MAPYPNLVSDSILVQETIDLLRECGGRANAAEIVDAVFKVSHIDEELASLLVADLVKEDKITGISDVNDETDRMGLRVVIILTRDAHPELHDLIAPRRARGVRVNA